MFGFALLEINISMSWYEKYVISMKFVRDKSS